MAPLGQVDHDNIERKLKDVVQELYQIMVQVSTYDAMGRSSRDVLTNEIKNLSQALQALHTAASPPNQLPSVPPELLEYVENGRNPDIYTREFVETVRRGNQLLKGKLHAFGSFRDVLAAEMAVAMPELRQDVDRVCEATGGKPPVIEGEGEGGSAAEAGASGVAPPRAQDAAAAATAPGPSAPTPTPTPAPSSGA